MSLMIENKDLSKTEFPAMVIEKIKTLQIVYIAGYFSLGLLYATFNVAILRRFFLFLCAGYLFRLTKRSSGNKLAYQLFFFFHRHSVFQKLGVAG